MPLQDSFGKKGTKSQPEATKPGRARSLSHAPTVDDLMSAMRTAQDTVRQPVILTWKPSSQAPVHLLTVIRNSGELEPTWILHADHKDDMTVLWSYSTTDTELIRNLITDQLLESAPAAVIPESLRRGAGTAEDASSQPQFFENYEIIDTIGQGGMGMIYKAHDRSDGSLVALKVLRADLMVDPSNVQRFKHEAAAVRSLKHRNLIGLREFGVSRFGQPFLAMDYIEGVELRDVLLERGHLDIPQFINVFTQICEALAYAHEQGLVHRDLKPGNIMLVKADGTHDSVKIIDFGIAKSVHENNGVSSITTFGHFLGSPAYMSPEQCGGAVLDARSDIYSLGCVMYEALTGMLPFHHDNILKVIFAQVNDNAAPLSAVRPDLQIPLDLEELIFKCLQKSPEDRYQSAHELCEELWEYAASGKAVRARLSATQQLKALRDTGPQQPAVPPHAPSPHHGSANQQAPSLDHIFLAPGQAQQAQSAQNVPVSVAEPPQQSQDFKRTQPMAPASFSFGPSSQAAQPVRATSVTPPPPAVSRVTKVHERTLSELALQLLLHSGAVSADLLRVVVDCVQSVDKGDITMEQAVNIIHHATGKHHME